MCTYTSNRYEKIQKQGKKTIWFFLENLNPELGFIRSLQKSILYNWFVTDRPDGHSWNVSGKIMRSCRYRFPALKVKMHSSYISNSFCSLNIFPLPHLFFFQSKNEKDWKEKMTNYNAIQTNSLKLYMQAPI